MNTFISRITGLLAVLLFVAPLAASAASISVQSLAPSATVFAKTSVTFTIVPAGFQTVQYRLSDSFSPTTASVNNIDPGGKFTWTPSASDAGTHVLTLTATDSDGNTAQTTQTITVLPPPSIAIQSVSSAGPIMSGTKFTFTVMSTGFTNPRYVVGDEFSGSSVGNANIDSSGNFSWTPDLAQNGDHKITVYASDSLGHSSEKSVAIQVGAGPSISILTLLPGPTVSLGQTVTFTANPMNYSPTAFSVSDAYSGVTSITGLNINSSGLFSWTPQGSEVGTHVITVSATVGAYGKSASAAQTITVLGPGGVVPPPTAPASTASSTALSTLQAQLAALQAQLGSHVPETTPAAAAPASGTPRYVFKKFLKVGSKGTEVLELQKVLVTLGYLSDEPSGYYGKLTQAAVKKFQKAHGLDQFGYVGPGTRAALNK